MSWLLINRQLLVAVLLCLSIVIEVTDSRSVSELLSKLELEDKSRSVSHQPASSNNDAAVNKQGIVTNSAKNSLESGSPDPEGSKLGDQLQTLIRQASKRNENRNRPAIDISNFPGLHQIRAAWEAYERIHEEDRQLRLKALPKQPSSEFLGG